ncbi:type II toxin-antitoxin system RelE/ParE family toxin [Nitrolancea hollandica]|uniref:type II toxin-antitoxin system RelE/ParE family toxin n=1 Tax=Nitrolancea hollandica TaxID=1206749 RepID=UPI00058E39C2|nr:type II toxin-antitoxin system RelE/ParE family toxin [Nitrolancea hollandica]
MQCRCYTQTKGWEVEYTDEFGEWFSALDESAQDAIVAAVEVLEERGPGLGRPLVDTISGTRYPNMKELRPLVGNIRILFAFDPRRCAILLIGGDKTGRWQQWYEEMIPKADRLYDEHLEILRKEKLFP